MGFGLILFLLSASHFPLASARAPSSGIPVLNPNAAGYFIFSGTNNIATISSSFIVPTLACQSDTEELVGILVVLANPSEPPFGFAGLVSACPGNGSATPIYFAFWEHPGGSGFASWTPNAGDKIALAVGFSGTTLTDVTQGETTAGAGTGVYASAAGCILTHWTPTQPHYDVVSFQGCKANVDGLTKPIGNLGSLYTLVDLILANSDPVPTILAQPGRLSAAGNFNIFYRASGP